MRRWCLQVKNQSLCANGRKQQDERFLLARHAHLFFVNKGRGKTGCLADWVMWQRVSKRHFLLQQRMALGGNH